MYHLNLDLGRCCQAKGSLRFLRESLAKHISTYNFIFTFLVLKALLLIRVISILAKLLILLLLKYSPYSRPLSTVRNVEFHLHCQCHTITHTSHFNTLQKQKPFFSPLECTTLPLRP